MMTADDTSTEIWTVTRAWEDLACGGDADLGNFLDLPVESGGDPATPSVTENISDTFTQSESLFYILDNENKLKVHLPFLEVARTLSVTALLQQHLLILSEQNELALQRSLDLMFLKQKAEGTHHLDIHYVPLTDVRTQYGWQKI